MEALQSEQFDRADDFLHALWRHNDRWKDAPKNWLFRGQADATWSLIPSALRDGLIQFRDTSGVHRPAAHHGEQLLAECREVQSFMAELDRQGVSAPTEAAQGWADADEMYAALIKHGASEEWPPRFIAPLFALAQHHGIPTRLLDWSERPMVAAYFAAVDGARRLEAGVAKPESRLAVWAIDEPIGEMIFTLLEDSPVYPAFRTVRPPRATNPNLRAQEGVSTVVVDRGRRYEGPIAFPSLNQLIVDRCETSQAIVELSGPVLRRLELPMHQCPRLLKMLADDHVSATYLFPGIDGVAQGVLERRLWDGS